MDNFPKLFNHLFYVLRKLFKDNIEFSTNVKLIIGI